MKEIWSCIEAGMTTQQNAATMLSEREELPHCLGWVCHFYVDPLVSLCASLMILRSRLCDV